MMHACEHGVWYDLDHDPYPECCSGDDEGPGEPVPLHRLQESDPQRWGRPDVLADFLLARIAEDEAGAKMLAAGGVGRPLAECEAKRGILRHCQLALSVNSGEVTELRWLASVYADHPDYREEWRPW